MIKKENYFPKEELLDAYFASELILVKENGKYRFAVHYYPGIPAVKILHNDKDILNTDVEFANFVLTDPDRRCRLSHGNTTKPFKSYFLTDIAFGVADEEHNTRSDYKNLDYVIAPICKTMIERQDALRHTDARMSLKEILAYEKQINKAIFKTKDVER